MRRKFAARCWILRILKHAGISSRSLVEVYCLLVRPILEYPSNVFHSMLSKDLSESLERLQRIALKSIFGLNRSYESCLEEAAIPGQDSRRGELLESFTVKMSESPLFSATWFPEKEASMMRRQDKYVQEFANCQRLQDAPIYAMRRLLNEKLKKTPVSPVRLKS